MCIRDRRQARSSRWCSSRHWVTLMSIHWARRASMSAGEGWALYRQALDASMDGMALLDAAGRYVYANAAHAAAYGFAHAEDIIGQSWRILYDDEQLRFIDEQVFPVLQRQGHWQGQAVGKRRDGSLFPLSLIHIS